MKRMLGVLTGISFLALATTSALATTIGIADELPPGTLPSGLIYENFSTLPAGSAGGTTTPNGLKVTFTGDAQAVTGSVANQYAAPWIFSATDPSITTPFGHAAGPDGPDTMQYLTTGTGTVDILLPQDVNFLGLLMGSLDNYNSVEFLKDGVSLGVLSGAQILANPTGDQGPDGTRFVELQSLDGVFNELIFRSTQDAFEFSDMAFGTVPAPEAWTIAMFTAGLLGLAFFASEGRRRRDAMMATPA